VITGVFGLPGAGKSSFLAYLAQRAARGKSISVGVRPFFSFPIGDAYPYKRIYSNFPIAGCYKLDWDMIGLVDFSECLILIDEIMHVCDSREWKNFSQEKKYWFSMHRHYKVDIIYCSQGFMDTDVRIRNLTAQLLYIQNVGVFSRVTPIAKSWFINKNIEERFELLPPLKSSYIFRRRYYHLFDSYTAKKLPENPASLWEVQPYDRKRKAAVAVVDPQRNSSS